MSEEEKTADEVTEVIRKVFDECGLVEAKVDQEKNMRISWVHAAEDVKAVAMEALRMGQDLESITITRGDVGFKIDYAVTELAEINSVSVKGKVSV